MYRGMAAKSGITIEKQMKVNMQYGTDLRRSRRVWQIRVLKVMVNMVASNVCSNTKPSIRRFK